MTDYTPQQPPRLVKRTTRVLPDGTKEIIEEYVDRVHTFTVFPSDPLLPTGGKVLPDGTVHSCPLTDPANAGKPMLYSCPVCNGVTC